MLKEPLLLIKDLVKYFPIKKGILSRTVNYVKAVDGVSFAIHKGETLGLQAKADAVKPRLAG